MRFAFIVGFVLDLNQPLLEDISEFQIKVKVNRDKKFLLE